MLLSYTCVLYKTHLHVCPKTCVHVSSAEFYSYSCTVLYMESVLRWLDVSKAIHKVGLTPDPVSRDLLVNLMVSGCFRRDASVVVVAGGSLSQPRWKLHYL